MTHLFGLPLGVVVIAVAGIVLGGVIAVTAIYFEHQRRRLWHDTARLALEKGQPLPPTLDEEHRRPPHARGPAGDFRTGLILIGTGIGLYYLVGRGVAAVVGCIGVALLLSALFSVAFSRKNPPQDPPSHS